LLTGYAWALVPGLTGWWPHLLHSGLAGLRLVPVAACVAWAVAPAPLTPAGLQAARLAGLSPWRRGWWSQVHGEARRWWAAGLVTTVYAWGEFELASRLAVPAWAVRLFDAQAGGADLGRTLLVAAPGIAVQAGLLGLLALVVRGAGPTTSEVRRSHLAAGVVLTLGSLVLMLGPLALVLADASRDWRGVLGNLGLGRELLATGCYATTAAIVAWLVAGALGRRVWPLAALGLAGSLAVGLVVAATLRLPGLESLRATPLPLTAALVILLLPAAAVGRWLVADASPAAARHAAQLLAVGDAQQQRQSGFLHLLLEGRLALRVVLALALLAASDCAAAAILAPADMGTVTPLLYNFMHYGRSPALSGRLLTAVVLPLLVVATVELTLAAWLRWRRG
jgi:hypothetical protein